MKRFNIRWKNFRSLEDTGWLEIRPITIVIGPNGSGKTSVLAPLLLLKQTLQSLDLSLPFKSVGEFFNAGSFRDLLPYHNIRRDLTLAIRFHHQDSDRSAKPKRIGEEPPGEVELTFSYHKKTASPVLASYVIHDVFGRPMLKHVLEQSGKYRLISAMPKLTSTARVRTSVGNATPQRFLFSSEPILRSVFEPMFKEKRKEISDKKKKKKGSETVSREAEVTIGKPLALYMAAISFVAEHIEQLLSEISFIGPLRENATRFYEMSGEKPVDVGTRGEFAPEILFRERNTKLLKEINDWVGRFEPGASLRCNRINNDIFSISLVYGSPTAEVNLADTGFGLSQVLPLVVQGLHAAKESLIIAEQPEIHLNPRLQVLLADLFQHVAADGRAVLVETHSEHMLLSIRRLVAEGRVKSDDVSVLYVEKDGARSTVRPIPIQGSGHIDKGIWPVGFFEDSLRESLALAGAQMVGKKK